MSQRILRRSVSICALALAGALPALSVNPASAHEAHGEKLDVVASFSILADMVSNVGGDLVDVTSIVGANEDAHVFEPVPADVVGVTEADLVLMNGIGFEGFMARLIESSGTSAPVVTVSEGILVIENEGDDHDDHDDHAGHDDHDDHDDEHASHDHDHGEEEHAHDDHDHDHEEEHAHDDHDHDHDEHAHDDHGHDHDKEEHAGHDDHDHDEHAHDHHGHDHGPIDPHAWQSIDAAKIYVANIAAGLCSVDADHCSIFEANAAAYTAELEALEAEIEAAFDEIPEEQRVVITGHDAFGYFARDFDLTFLAPQGMSTESEASAADVAEIVDQIRDTGARALFVENITDSRLIETIASETGLSVADAELYSDALSGPDGPAATYIDMMRHNVTAIADALTAGS